jgi:hypothetical protein
MSSFFFRWEAVSADGSEYLELNEVEKMSSFTNKELHRAEFWFAIFRQSLALPGL